jgi:oxygen-independent coproporphyrinogen-3 oxidase
MRQDTAWEWAEEAALPYKALYIHVPFCKSRCSYCDFYTRAASQDDAAIDDWLEGVVRQIRRAARDGLLASIETFYVGGGTPTHIGPRRLVSLLYTLAVSADLASGAEFTIEANPESLSPALVRDIYSLGANRASLGVQSLVDTELAALGRAHDSGAARDAVGMLRQRFDNVSIDLICGIPGQGLGSWRHTLRSALSLEPSHVSVYPLTLEAGTPMAAAVEAGEAAVPDEDAQADMMLEAQSMLKHAGLERYETASYALAGRECRHNIAYWTGAPYLGLGPGAAGMRMLADGRRRRLHGGRVTEALSAGQAAVEDLMLGMRMARGVDDELVKAVARHAPGVHALFEELTALGLADRRSGGFTPTERGWLMGNELHGRIWGLSEGL